MTDIAPPPRGRLLFFAALALAAACLLSWRWHNLQVERFSHYAQLAHDNQLAVLPVEPPRGRIFDRRGEPLAVNETVYSLQAGSDFAGAVLGKIDSLRRVVAISDSAVKKLTDSKNSRVYKGVITLREKLSEEEVAAFLSWQFLFPEIVLESELARHYPLGDSAGHVIGHVGRLSDRDVKKLKENALAGRYRGAKFIGKTGVELIYESALRGDLGVQEAQVDAHGRVFSRRVRQRPAAGGDIYLTLDMRLQRLAELSLSGESGAAVLMDCRSGELLALASSPRFDINQFVFGISPSDWKELNASEQKPLIHRAIYGQYAPGSTIKPFLALAALQNGWRDSDYQYHSKGFFQLGEHRFHDWKKGGHGVVDIARSIVRSVNSFYYELGNEIGIEKLRAGLLPFGFGRPPGVDLDNEKGGVLPDAEWKKTTYGEEWFPGETVSASVGQGYLQATPLQMAAAMCMIASGGIRPRPFVYQPTGEPATHFMPPDDLELVREALSNVTRPGGTAVSVGRGAAYGIAGKTGTAQVAKLRLDAEGERVKNEDLPKKLRDHAWFVGYAPADIPQVAAAVIVENSGSGGRIAGPIARKLLDGYLLEEGRLPPPPEESDSESGENVAADAESESQESQTESSVESENDSESDSDSADSENNSESENISEDDSENGGDEESSDEESADDSSVEQNEDGEAIESAALEFANLSLLKSKTQLEGGDG